MLSGVLCVCFDFIHFEDIHAEHHFSKEQRPWCNVIAKCVHCGQEYGFTINGICNENDIKEGLRHQVDILLNKD